jgi:hypothetical protein
MLKNHRFAVVRSEAYIGLQLMKSSRILSRVNWFKATEVSWIISLPRSDGDSNGL